MPGQIENYNTLVPGFYMLSFPAHKPRNEHGEMCWDNSQERGSYGQQVCVLRPLSCELIIAVYQLALEAELGNNLAMSTPVQMSLLS